MHWLTKRRKEVGLETQSDLEARLQLAGFNVTRAAISHWENNRNNPPLDDPDFRQVLARILRLSPHEILKLAGYEVDKPQHTAAGERAASIIDHLPPEKQELAIRLIEQLAD